VTTVVKAAGAADFLGLVPQILGYRPTESVLVIPFGGDARTRGVLRFDMPAPENFATAASTMLGLACKVEGAEAVAFVTYTDTPVDQVQGLGRILTAMADVVGLTVRDSLYVTPEGWGSTVANDGVHPLSEIQAEEHVPVREGDQSTIVEPTLDPEFVDQTLAALDEIADQDEVGSVVELVERVMSQDGTPTPSDMAWVAVIFALPSLRDTALVTITRGLEMGHRAEQAQRGWEQGEDYPVDLALVMWGDGDQPDPDRLERMLTLAHMAALLDYDDEATAGAWSVAAWAAWALGRSTNAETLARRGLEAWGNHGLCDIVASFVRAGHLPDWAFTKKG
jgi:hypothetical protein